MRPARVKAITPADVPAMRRNVAAGVRSYAAWAPAGWSAEPVVWEEAGIRAHLAAPGFLGWITEDHAAHVAAYPAADEPGAFHLMHLFVAPEQQGTGIATALHDRLVDGVRAAGGTVLRLRTPYGNARGVAFYEREGWAQHGSAGLAPHLGLECVWMRRPV